MMVIRNASEISESNSMEMLLYVSFAVERIARFELCDTGDIFSKIWYYDKALVVEDLRMGSMRLGKLKLLVSKNRVMYNW